VAIAQRHHDRSHAHESGAFAQCPLVVILCVNTDEYQCLQLENEDERDEYRLVDLENLRVEALLVEIFVLTTDEKIDEASQKIRRFAMDLDPYFIERPSEGKEILHSTATLAAEVRRKRTRG
jgi:hypothetical protein